jgi:hypothetical protein
VNSTSGCFPLWARLKTYRCRLAAEPSKRGAKGRIKGTRSSTPSEPPDLRARTFDFPPWLTHEWRCHYTECFGRCRLRAYSSMRRSYSRYVDTFTSSRRLIFSMMRLPNLCRISLRIPMFLTNRLRERLGCTSGSDGVAGGPCRGVCGGRGGGCSTFAASIHHPVKRGEGWKERRAKLPHPRSGPPKPRCNRTSFSRTTDGTTSTMLSTGG